MGKGYLPPYATDNTTTNSSHASEMQFTRIIIILKSLLNKNMTVTGKLSCSFLSVEQGITCISLHYELTNNPGIDATHMCAYFNEKAGYKFDNYSYFR